MNTADGTDRRKIKSVRMEYNIVLDYFPVSQQNIWVQIVNFFSFPLKSGEEKNNFFYNKIGTVLVFFFCFFNVTFFLLRGQGDCEEPCRSG